MDLPKPPEGTSFIELILLFFMQQTEIIPNEIVDCFVTLLIFAMNQLPYFSATERGCCPNITLDCYTIHYQNSRL